MALPYQARVSPTIDKLNNYMEKVKERVDVHNSHRLAMIQHDISGIIGLLDSNRRLQVDSHTIIAQLLQSIASDKTKETDHTIESTPPATHVRSNDNLYNKTCVPKVEPSTTLLQQIPDPQINFEHFKDCAIQSLRLEAKHSYLAIDLPNKPEVKTWLSNDTSALLWIDGYADPHIGKWTTDFASDVLLKTEEHNIIPLFYFGDIATKDSVDASPGYLASPRALIHSFIVQLLRRHAYLAETEAGLITPQRWVKVRHNTRAAWNLLHRIMQSLAAERWNFYLTIDSIDALDTMNSDMQPFLRRLSDLVTNSKTGSSERSSEDGFIKILITAVTGNAHQLLFPPAATSTPPSHYIVRVPQTFGKHNVASIPAHLRKPSAKRLVRLPDSDDEFGLRPADSFGFSDEEDEDLMFSSDEDTLNVNQNEKSTRREMHTRNSASRQDLRSIDRPRTSGDSDSSEDLDFSENEFDSRSKQKQDTDDIAFSSSSGDEL